MLRDASANPKATGGDGLRAAMAAHRTSTGALADEIRARAQPGGRPLSPAMLDRSVSLLHAAVADAGLSHRVVAGWVTEERARTPPPPPRKPVDADADPVPKIDAEAVARAARRDELELEIRTGVEEIRRLRAEATEREMAATAARGQLEEATRRLRRTESGAAAAHHAVDEAAEHLRVLRAELDDA